MDGLAVNVCKILLQQFIACIRNIFWGVEIIVGLSERSKMQHLRVDKLLVNPQLLKSFTTALE